MKLGFWINGCIGDYRVEAQLGEGGFARVFRGADRNERRVAIKVLQEGLLGDDDARKRFDREMRILKDFRHPNVIELIDYGVDGEGHAWYAMPEMPGGTLATLITRERTWEEVVALMLEITRGLAAYHAIGPDAIHRDIKLDNVLLDERGHPRLADFGVARCPEITGSSMTRNANGTAAYMAPEVWEHRGNQASDVYALGIMFWELVNGRRHTMPARPPKLLVNAPGFEPMDALYKAMTAQDWTKRPSANEVVARLERFLAGLQRVPEPKKNSDNWVAVGLGLLAAFGLAGLVVAAVDDAQRSRPTRRRSRRY